MFEEDFAGDARPDATPKPYVHQPFPSWRYHRTGEKKLIHSQDEHDELTEDADWSEFVFPGSAEPETRTIAAINDDTAELRAALRLQREDIEALKSRVALLESSPVEASGPEAPAPPAPAQAPPKKATKKTEAPAQS